MELFLFSLASRMLWTTDDDRHSPRPHLARIVLVFPADAYLTSSSVVVC